MTRALLAACLLLSAAGLAHGADKRLPVYSADTAAQTLASLPHAIVLVAKPSSPTRDRSRRLLAALAEDYSRMAVLEVDCAAGGEFCSGKSIQPREDVYLFRDGVNLGPLYMGVGTPQQVAAEAESRVFSVLQRVSSLSQARNDFRDGMRQYGLLGADEQVGFEPGEFSFGSPDTSSAVRFAGQRGGVRVTPFAAHYFSTLFYVTCTDCDGRMDDFTDYFEHLKAPARVYVMDGTSDALHAIQEGHHFVLDLTPATTKEEVEKFVLLHGRPILPLLTDETFHFFASAGERTTMIVIADAANSTNGFADLVERVRGLILEGLRDEGEEMSTYAEKYAFAIIDGATDASSLRDADIVPIEMPAMVAYRLSEDGALFFPLRLSPVDTEKSIPVAVEWMEDMKRPLIPLDKVQRRAWRERREEEARKAARKSEHDEL